MFIKKLVKHSKGDTIVEVLISIAVLSLVLTISYALSNRDSQYIQQAQERSEAQNISEQQLELLRNYLTPTSDWTGSHFLCFDDSGNPSTHATDCHKGTKDNGVGRYYAVINYDSTTKTYTVSTNWSSLTSGTQQQSLVLSYKLPVSALGAVGIAPQCRDHLDNDGDGKIDLADPGCLGNPDRNDEVEPPVNLAVNVKKIPPLAGNVTPNCSYAATQNRSGASVTVTGVGTQVTGGTSSTTFTPLSPTTNYTTSVTGPSGYTVCPPVVKTTATGNFGTTTTVDYKMYPNCSPSAVWHPGYSGYNYGNRRADLDGYYLTMNGAYPTWNSSFIAGNVYTGGLFYYVFSGDTSRNPYAYYWLWEAVYYYVPGYYTYDGPNTCP